MHHTGRKQKHTQSADSSQWRFPRRLSGRSQQSLQQQHLAPPTVAGGVAPHRAEQDLSPSCDAMSCVVMSSFKNNDVSLLGTPYTGGLPSYSCQVTSFSGDGIRRKHQTHKRPKTKWKAVSRATDTPTQQRQSGSSRTQSRYT